MASLRLVRDSFSAVDDFEQSRFAGIRGANDAENFVAADVEAHVAQHLFAAVERGDFLEVEMRFRHGRATSVCARAARLAGRWRSC